MFKGVDAFGERVWRVVWQDWARGLQDGGTRVVLFVYIVDGNP